MRLEPYDYHGFEVANVVAEIAFGRNPAQRILIGAHYGSVAGTVGADDNASAVAVQLETAREVMALKGSKDLDLEMVFVSIYFLNFFLSQIANPISPVPNRIIVAGSGTAVGCPPFSPPGFGATCTAAGFDLLP